jgi:hypothetical protein
MQGYGLHLLKSYAAWGVSPQSVMRWASLATEPADSASDESGLSERTFRAGTWASLPRGAYQASCRVVYAALRLILSSSTAALTSGRVSRARD